MEGNRLPEILSAPVMNFGCVNELTRSNLDTLASTAENGEDILSPSGNAPDDDCSPWTNEKHSLYLTQLEVSFVKHLHQSRDLLVQSSEKNQIDKNVSQKRPTNIQSAAEQFTVLRFGHCPRISNERDKPFFHVSSDTHNCLSSPWIDNFRRIRTCHQPLSSDMQQFLNLHCSKNHISGKEIVSPQLAACSDQFSARKSDKVDSFDLMIEGVGQNFVNQDNSYNSNNKSRAKRLKTAVADYNTQESLKTGDLAVSDHCFLLDSHRQAEALLLIDN